jgi:hypothetical protein
MPWARPSLSTEIEELQRTANELGIADIIDRFHRGKLVSLNDRDWEQMRNTDSWGTVSVGDARALGAVYGRDVARLIDGLSRGAPVPAPIVLGGDSRYLVAGNTRLMVARALGIRPVVWLI